MTTTASWHPSRWTLRTKLVAWMLLLFVAVTLAVGALSVWQLSRTLNGQLDNQLRQSAARFNGQYSDTIGGPPPVAGESIRVTLLSSTGRLAPLAVRYRDGSTGVETDNYVYGFKSPRSLSDKQIAVLQAAGIGSSPKTVELGGYLGEYRVIAVHSEAGVGIGPSLRNAGVTTIIGLPIGPNRSTVAKTAIAIALLSGSGVILVALAATYIIRRNLEPLRRVAATATRVSKLPLSSGEVVMPERVEPRDTDERTEVGQVGASLNDMLDHVYHALSARQASETQVRQFVADASHELRTPLASIRGYAELSRRETEPVPQGVTHALGRIESEADRMTTLVEDLLLLARLDAGRPLNFEPVELPLIAIETISDARAAGLDHR
ncbi:histidine kinase dimerization/phospho-acceptor domain-containing protein, partial [Flexivirga sp.]|uniref:histidine kinase dimerization/phospho-acceptor domain-containing protein n=1 Tax=Flexivirga sp. TaxID=1962927 RepID=UPI003F7ED314